MTSATPRVSVTMRQNGQPIAAATAGSTIALEVEVRQTQPGQLHYKWASDSPGLVPADASAVTMTTPATPTGVTVEITNGNGGLLKLGITVPVATASSQQNSPLLGILTDNGMLFGILDDNGSL
jgi:hypothetical protein